MNILFFLTIVIAFDCSFASLYYKEFQYSRSKRSDCSSSYNEWSEWSTCSMNCGYCGTQARTRSCQAVENCDEPICTGKSMETQECGDDPKICYYPTVSCCNKEYQKMLDLDGKRFYCGLKESYNTLADSKSDETSNQVTKMSSFTPITLPTLPTL